MQTCSRFEMSPFAICSSTLINIKSFSAHYHKQIIYKNLKLFIINRDFSKHNGKCYLNIICFKKNLWWPLIMQIILMINTKIWMQSVPWIMRDILTIHQMQGFFLQFSVASIFLLMISDSMEMYLQKTFARWSLSFQVTWLFITLSDITY